VFDPQHGPGQVGEAGGEAVPDNLRGEALDHLVAPVFGQFAAQDHRGVARVLAGVYPYTGPTHPVAVAPALVYVVVHGLQGLLLSRCRRRCSPRGG
jgi:hypothetical protein